MGDTLRAARYVILGVLGEGSQGQTFDAVDKQVGQAVAIKRFDVRGARAWKDVDLAERETRVLQSLSHPNLPRYIDHFEEDGVLYLVTEKMAGADLARRRRQGAPFGEAEAMRLLEDAAKVFAYLHGRSPPVVHRDVKPANVIQRPDGSYGFVDFGAVRDNLRPGGGSTVVGTFGYMAPEQFQGRALPSSDVYGVGATVVSLLAGSEPESLPHRGLAVDVRAALAGRTSERMIGILERMLEPDPDRRPAEIAPLLREAPQDVVGSRWSMPQEWSDPSWRRDWRREARDEARRARKAAREVARAWRRDYGPVHRHSVAWPLEVIFTLAFSLGIIAVSAVMRLAVPLVLRILSVFVARRSLTAAADAVQEAGGAAVRAMTQSRRWMRDEASGGRTRVASEEVGEPVQRERPEIRVALVDDEADHAGEEDHGSRGKR